MVEDIQAEAQPASPTLDARLPLGAALAASSLLAACGGGAGDARGAAAGPQPSGAGSLAPLASTATAAGYVYPSAK